MKKKLISLLQRKRHIVALSTILMTFIVMSCLFIDSVENIVRILPVVSQVLCRNAQIMRHKIFRQNV